jgi:hypothetical protein
MDVRLRTPLVIAWQTGIEISRVLSMQFPTGQSTPMKIDL